MDFHCTKTKLLELLLLDKNSDDNSSNIAHFYQEERKVRYGIPKMTLQTAIFLSNSTYPLVS